MQTRQAKAPISAHPLFPAVVAVWFAALLGLGSGVLPNILFERVITATGISSLIPSATPPLGATFRIILSLSFGTAGAALGFVLARKLAAAQHIDRPASAVSRLSPRPDPAPRIETKRRPISVKEEMGDTRLDPIVNDDEAPSAAPLPGRRRSLAMAEDERKSDFFTHAPLPVPGAQPAPQEPTMEQPLDLTSFAAPEPVEDPVYVPSVEPRVEPESIVDRGLQGLRNRSPFAKPFGDEGEAPMDIAPASFAAPVAAELPADEEPLPFAAPSQAAQPQFEPEPEPRQIFAPVAEPEPEPKQVFAAAAEVAEPVLPSDPKAELADLGMVQLAERLGASLQKRRNARPASQPDFVAGLKADFGIETAAEPEIVPGSAIFGGSAFAEVAPDAPPPPPVIPEALRPLPLSLAEEEDEDDDTLIPSLSLPLSGLSIPAPVAASDDEEEDELDDIGEAEENYSSLLAMNNPFRAQTEFVRIEEPEPEDGTIEPAVVFPGETAAPEEAAASEKPEARPFDSPGIGKPARTKADPEETERALRSALATLQRMSGAA